MNLTKKVHKKTIPNEKTYIDINEVSIYIRPIIGTPRSEIRYTESNALICTIPEHVGNFTSRQRLLDYIIDYLTSMENPIIKDIKKLHLSDKYVTTELRRE